MKKTTKGQTAALATMADRVESPEQAGRLHAEIGQAMRDHILPRAMRIGEYLARMKSELGHGNFLPWLESNRDALGFGGTQSRLYIRVHEHREQVLASGVTDLESAGRLLAKPRAKGSQQGDAGPEQQQPKMTVNRQFDVILPKPGTKAHHMLQGMADRLSISIEDAAVAMHEIDQEWQAEQAAKRAAQQSTAKPKRKGPQLVNKHVRLRSDQDKKLRKQAKRQRMPESELMRTLIDMALSTLETK